MNSQLMMPTVDCQANKGFDELYFEVINQTVRLLNVDSSKLQAVRNERTGQICHTFTSGIGFSFKLSEYLPLSMLRNFYPKTAAAECAWFFRGEQDSTFIEQYCGIWKDFTENDGKTIKAAYGYRWRKHFGRDQVEDLVQCLMKDPSNRRTVLCAWDPGDDGLMNMGTKNVPCPFAMSFYIVNGKLMCSYFIRSSDLYVGLPYDIMCTAYVVDALVHEIRQRATYELISSPNSDPVLHEKLCMLANLDHGSMSTFLGNPHMYDNHVELAQEAMRHYREHKRSWITSEMTTGQTMAPKLPGWSVSEITGHSNEFVGMVGEGARNCIMPGLAQRPEVAV